VVYYAFKASDGLAKYVSLNSFRHLDDMEKAERQFNGLLFLLSRYIRHYSI
jgi:hypothetical protein